MAQQSIIDAIKDTLIIFDGAMGTELYRRGIFTNRCYEELNLTDKKLVDQIEGEYLDAGAEVLTTNTYGANPLALEKFGLRDKTAAINKAGVEIAKQAIANRGSQAWVAGDVGPLASYTDNPVELILEQVRALIDAQCDFIFFETLPNIAAIEVVALAMQKLAQEGTPFPYAVSCALVKNCETISGEFESMPPSSFTVKGTPGVLYYTLAPHMHTTAGSAAFLEALLAWFPDVTAQITALG